MIEKQRYKSEIVDDEARRLGQRCIDAWGVDAQINQAIEELSELITVLCHVRRKTKMVKRDELIKEIADVKIMVKQLEIIFAVDCIELVVTTERIYDRLEAMLNERKNGKKNKA